MSPVKTSEYYINANSAGVYVKEGEFFKSQGGLTKKWGKSWELIQARDLDDARQIGIKIRRERYPNTHYTIGETEEGPQAIHPSPISLRILKYTINPGVNEFSFPVGHKILGVQAQFNSPKMWVLIDPDERDSVVRNYVFFPTGQLIENYGLVEFIGTFQLNDGNLVYHLFEVRIRGRGSRIEYDVEHG